MYIVKNALRCIGRSKGRNILIGIIVLVIAVSACLGLSIRQAAESAKKNTLDDLTVTASISYDRSSMMNGMRGGGDRPDGKFDRDQFGSRMGGASSLTLEEYQTYASAASVQDFYYTVTASFNGNDALEPVSDETSEDEETTAASEETTAASEETSEAPGADNPPGFGGFGGGGDMGFPGGRGGSDMFSSADFSVIGYSSDTAMSAFKNGNASILDGGTMFEEGTAENVCVISEELAIYNDLSVGDTITLVNPSLETETYELKIVGLYKRSENNVL